MSRKIRRGISPLIAFIMIVAIAVSIGAVSTIWSKQFETKQSEAVTQQYEEAKECGSVRFEVGFDYDNCKILLYNPTDTKIENIKADYELYNGSFMAIDTALQLEPDEKKTINWPETSIKNARFIPFVSVSGKETGCANDRWFTPKDLLCMFCNSVKDCPAGYERCEPLGETGICIMCDNPGHCLRRPECKEPNKCDCIDNICVKEDGITISIMELWINGILMDKVTDSVTVSDNGLGYATVQIKSLTTTPPNGLIKVYDNNALIMSKTNPDFEQKLDVGTHNITAFYDGSISYQGSYNKATVTVTSAPVKIPSIVNLTLANGSVIVKDPRWYDSDISIAAGTTLTIKAETMTPTEGRVSVYYDNALLGSGKSAYTTTVKPAKGVHNITMYYAGDATYLGSYETHRVIGILIIG